MHADGTIGNATSTYPSEGRYIGRRGWVRRWWVIQKLSGGMGFCGFGASAIQRLSNVCTFHSNQYISPSQVPVAVLVVVFRMSLPRCSPKLGDDYPPGFKILKHEIYQDEEVNKVPMNLDDFLKFPEYTAALGREGRTFIRRERLAAEGSNITNIEPYAKPGLLKWFHIPANHMLWVDVSQVSEEASARSMRLIPSNSSRSLQHTMEEPVALNRNCGRTCFAPKYRETVYHLSMQHTCYLLSSRPGLWRSQISTPC